MMVKMRRTRCEIVIDILKLCLEPRKKTEIVYLCNLNFRLIKDYLSCLLEKGWIKKVHNLYETTESGNHILLEVLSPAMGLITACLT